MTTDLVALVTATDREKLPALVAQLAAAQAAAAARLMEPEPKPERSPAARLITPVQAAEIAGIKPKRLYEWARRKPWAHRPNQRTLRIDETGFRRWLESR